MATITLKDVVYDIIYTYDPICARLFNQIYEVNESIPDHLWHMNQFWRVQFAMFPASETHIALQCLQDNAEFHDWLRLFREYVAPLIARYRLPTNVDYRVADDATFDVDTICERLTGVRPVNYV